jgi:hypothetical protein
MARGLNWACAARRRGQQVTARAELPPDPDIVTRSPEISLSAYADLPEEEPMRQSLYLVAALMTFVLVGPGAALAFDVQTLGAANPDGSANYADPDEKFEKSPLGDSGTLAIPRGLNFGKTTGASVPSYNQSPDNGWQHLAPIGRLTH